MQIVNKKPSALALIPFLIFAIFYIGLSLVAQYHYKVDMPFYAVPMPVAFIVASASALFLGRRQKLDSKIDTFARGMGEMNIMIMCLIFILAGAFSIIAQKMGAVQAAVDIFCSIIPPRFILAGTFIISCTIATAIGSSCGTIAAITPIVCGLIEPLHISPTLLIGAVIGGSMFGDNLSMISDTTIAATRTQGIGMREKFIKNIKIAIPAAIATIVIYCLIGKSFTSTELTNTTITLKHFILITPYILIFILAVASLNVMLLLFLGSILCAIIGIIYGSFNFLGSLQLIGSGCQEMSETLIVAILSGGLLALVRENGGIAWFVRLIERNIGSVRGCEIGISLLVTAVNLFTANNTIAIVISGPIAKTISDKFRASPSRIASILDTTSCVIQGIIPYGAQLLIATSLAKSSGIKLESMSLISGLYYQGILLVALVTSIAIFAKKRTSYRNT